MKPMLASDWKPNKVRFPVLAQPKIDGVRALNIGGQLTGRSLKPFGNKYITSLFSIPQLAGFDGEMAAQLETHPDLCRLTTSALSTHAGEPFVLWWLFDFIDNDTSGLPYEARYQILRGHMHNLSRTHPRIAQHLRLVPGANCENIDELEAWDERYLTAGYEGTILRDPYGKFKSGRSTAAEGGLLRIKRFVDFEAVVTGVTEGESNQNAATINALGHTERSTHQANMVANGLVGSLQCRALADVADIIAAGDQITVAAGCLTAAERKHYFEHPEDIVDKVIKAKFFPKGVKDKPRFPTFQSFRDPADMST